MVNQKKQIFEKLTHGTSSAPFPLPGQVVLVKRDGIGHQTLVRPFRTCVGCVPVKIVRFTVLNLE